MDIDDENGYALVEEDIISKDNICYNQVLLLVQIQSIQLHQQSPERVVRTAKPNSSSLLWLLC